MPGELLGLAYAGYAKIDGVPLLLMPSNPTESDNLLKSQGSISNQIQSALGEIPVRDRRSISLQLTCVLNNRAVPLIGSSSFDWWRQGRNGRSHVIEIFPANGDGYRLTEAYIQTISINAQENSLVAIAFNVIAYRYQLLPGRITPRNQQEVVTFLGDDNWPIPSWLTGVIHTGMPGITANWALSFNNNYQFFQLCEATVRPPTPRLVVPGPPSIELMLTNLAEPGIHPRETGAVTVKIGGGRTPAFIPQTVIHIPLVYRDPGQSPSGTGDQNSLIRWQATYKALGVQPTTSVTGDLNFPTTTPGIPPPYKTTTTNPPQVYPTTTTLPPYGTTSAPGTTTMDLPMIIRDPNATTTLPMIYIQMNEG